MIMIIVMVDEDDDDDDYDNLYFCYIFYFIQRINPPYNNNTNENAMILKNECICFNG